MYSHLNEFTSLQSVRIGSRFFTDVCTGLMHYLLIHMDKGKVLGCEYAEKAGVMSDHFLEETRVKVGGEYRERGNDL